MILILTVPIYSRDFLILGGSFSSAFYRSDDLDLFKQTYNSVNADGLSQKLRGIGNGAFGYRGEIGYRRFKALNYAVIGGWRQTIIRDGATFGNGEKRNLEYRFTGFFAEIEIGRKSKKNYYLNGIVNIALQRKIDIQSQNSSRSKPLAKSLDGDYHSGKTTSAYLGVAVGRYRDPLFIGFKILYPVYRGGRSRFLEDGSSAKQQAGTAVFPGNFIEYTTLPSYTGMHGDIDGLKLLLTMQLAFAL